MNHNQLPSGSLIVSHSRRGTPIYRAKWRDRTGRGCSLTVGLAWLVRAGHGWTRKPGRIKPGYFDEARARIRMAEMIARHDAKLRNPSVKPPSLPIEDMAEAWLADLARRGQVKPSTLQHFRLMLAQSGLFAWRTDLDPRNGAERS